MSVRHRFVVYPALMLLAVVSGQDLSRSFDPCQFGQVATIGQPYVLGFAYLPGGTPEDWQLGMDGNNNPIYRNPCNPADTAGMQGLETVVAVYSLKVETLQLLKTDANLQLLSTSLSANGTQTLSLVAYNGDFVTMPRVVVSNDTDVTLETGSVISMSLILQFNQGQQVVGYWSDRGCGTCTDDLVSALAASGLPTEFVPETTCLDTTACAVSIASCAECLLGRSDAEQKAACLTYCTTSINIAWAGTDSAIQPLISQYIITKSTDFSIAGLFTTQVSQAVDTGGELINQTQGVFKGLDQVVDTIGGLFG